MKKPEICAVITNSNINLVKLAEPMVDLFEVRIDLIGAGWEKVVKQLSKPWLACNRLIEEGGKCRENEERVEMLLKAVKLGASIIDIELRARELKTIVERIKDTRAECLISHHDFLQTPSVNQLKEIVNAELKAGADICKVVTTAERFEDNITILKLIPEFSGHKLVCLAMGELGTTSRVFCPLVGGRFTYAAIVRGRESAPGQMSVYELFDLYRSMKNE